MWNYDDDYYQLDYNQLNMILSKQNLTIEELLDCQDLLEFLKINNPKLSDLYDNLNEIMIN